ncbi:MAG: hypothetical protein ABW321_15385 [Polyangiales bacterium]
MGSPRRWVDAVSSALWAGTVLLVASVSAQPPLAAGPSDDAGLPRYLRAFAAKRLITVETADVTELRQQLAAAEQLALDGQEDEAVVLLVELTEHPRFADYTSLDEMSAALYALGGALHALGAEPSARHVLGRVLERGVSDRYFGPAFRRYVDSALADGTYVAALGKLAAYGGGGLPEDPRNELAYLQARQLQAAGDEGAAQTAYEQITRRSRFYANAQYQLGAMAAKARAFREAEQRFCRIAGPGSDRHLGLYVDGRYFRVKDWARLGLGRVAHEQRRGDDAFYYYFQVPSDSQRLPEALFEAAYARYEVEDMEGASDLLAQLEARFPRAIHADEAALLRGFVALAQCDYAAADRHFTRFNARFGPLVSYIDRVLDNPVRRASVYEALRAPQLTDRATPLRDTQRTLLDLLRVDPELEALHERVGQLDRESARAARLPETYALLRARYQGQDRPRPVSDPLAAESGALQQQLTDVRAGLVALNNQLDELRALRAPSRELAVLEAHLTGLGKRQRQLETTLDRIRRESAERERAALQPTAAEDVQPRDADPSADVAALLARDAAAARDFELRSLTLRPALIRAANQRALAEILALRERLGGFLRRSRIGRIDAVMGSQRRIEHQIERLAAGHMPEALRDPLRGQGFLADDEEYWPFEGEDWPDEYVERPGQPVVTVPGAGARR